MPKAHPRNVPEVYVMQPFEVKLTYRNRAWCTVTLEVSYNEVGDADEFDLVPLGDELKTMVLCVINQVSVFMTVPEVFVKEFV